MTVCSNRSDEPGFFTSCVTATETHKCVCGQLVAAQLAAETAVPVLDNQENP